MQKLEWRYHRQCGHSIFGGEEEEGWRQGLGRCGQVPQVGETRKLHFLLPWRGRGRELGCGFIPCPALCPPCPSSAFLIHSRDSGLCFQHTSKGLQAGSFWNFPWELVSWLVLPTKRQEPVGMEINVAKLDLRLSGCAGQTRKRNSAGGPSPPSCHLGRELCLRGHEASPAATKAHMKPQKHWVGVSNSGLFLTNAQVPDDDTDP